MTLDQLRIGQVGLVENISADPGLTQRLYEMGLMIGDEVQIVGYAPLGDPIEIRFGNTRLSLRKREAATISITLC